MVLHILLFGLVNLPKTAASGKVSPGLETPKDVVVIGGGLAGMAAARKLSNSPDKFSVKVLEARKERYGGRVYTKREYGVRGNGEIRNCCIYNALIHSFSFLLVNIDNFKSNGSKRKSRY